MNRRPVFALCTSRIHNPEILESVTAFVKEANSRGYAVLVFNASLEHEDPNRSEPSCYGVYDLIPFPATDLIVVMGEVIHEPLVIDSLAQIAKAHRVPMMSYDGRIEGVPSVYSYSNQAFDDLLDHVMGHHGCKRVDLLTGIRGNYGSECMVMAYREALRRHGLPFEDDRVGYGGYWDLPAMAATESFLAKDIPDAIVSVNDEMAIAACSVLRKHGLRVPEDVIVTGSDGIVKERFHSPRLTNCVKDYDRLCASAVDTAELLLEREDVKDNTEIRPLLHISESCGCLVTEQRDQNDAICDLYRQIRLLTDQESQEHWTLGAMLDRKSPSVIDYLDVLAGHIPEQSVLALRDCLSADLGTGLLRQFADGTELMSTVRHKAREKQFAMIQRGQLIPDLERVLAEHGAVLINSIYLQDEVYGYYTYYGDDLEGECFRMPKFIHTAGSVLGATLATTRLQQMNETLVAARIRDSLTGMLNLQGGMKMLTERMRTEDHSNDQLTMLVIGLNRLRQINSIFGRNEGDQALLSLAGAISDTIDSDETVARVGGDEFMVAFFGSPEYADTAEALTSVLKKRIVSYNQVSGKSYTLEISIGRVTSLVSTHPSLEAMLNEAITMKDSQRINGESEKPTVSEAEMAQMNRIMTENLLTYYFQPIVSARNGQIFAYEALMRTTGGFAVSPLTVLSYATNAGRLYEIEWLTYNNVLKIMRLQEERLKDKRIFINSIPGHFLTDQDFGKLSDVYSDLLPKLVVEFTEQAETEGEELRQIQARCAAHRMDIAVDDYGTGYSNIANLLRYSPNYVKIDRSLISNIHEEPKKQHFVTNIIDFAHANGFMALAEGVETAEELRAVIRFGVDLIQGNFTSVPNAIPLEAIPDRIAGMICKFSASAAKSVMQKTYMTTPEELSVSLDKLESEHYTDLFVAQQELEIIGSFGSPSGIHIKTKDEMNCRLILQNVHFNAQTQGSAILLGRNSHVTLEFRGDNRMDTGGILVPENSSLTLTGKGNLSIQADDTKAFAIGNDPDFACGDISIDLAGCLNIISNSNQCIGIGSGLGKGQRISVCGTKLFVEMSGKDGVGIGILDGNAEISLLGCEASFGLRMANSVAIGSKDGCPTIVVNTASFALAGSGTYVSGIGSACGGADITMNDSALKFEITGQNLFAIGSRDSAPKIGMRQCDLYLRIEGTRAMDVGSFEKDAELTIIDTDVDINIQSARVLHFAADPAHCIRSGGKYTVVINQ